MKRYQKKINVVKHKITAEWKSIWNILKHLPKDLSILEIGCAEGFVLWMARKRGHTNLVGIEQHRDKVKTGGKQLNVDLIHGDIFENMNLIKPANCLISCRFFHNIGWEPSLKILNKLNEKKSYIVIAKYKPGMFKENGKPRQPLATKKGLSRMFDIYDLKGKSFPGQTMVVAKGKYKKVPEMLRGFIKEGE